MTGEVRSPIFNVSLTPKATTLGYLIKVDWLERGTEEEWTGGGDIYADPMSMAEPPKNSHIRTPSEQQQTNASYPLPNSPSETFGGYF